MQITISFGWWLVPLAITLIAAGYCLWHDSKPQYGGWGSSIVSMIQWLLATIVILAAWLVWALVSLL